MTTATIAAGLPTVPARGSAHRILTVFRLHTVNKFAYLGLPWIISIGVAVATLIVSIVVLVNLDPAVPREQAFEGMVYSWGVLAPFWYLLAVSALAISNTFPFALGMGATRREFALGTILAFVALAAIMAGGITLLAELEKATGGWWVGMHNYTSLWLGVTAWPVTFLSLFSLQMLAFSIVMGVAVVYMRWRSAGILWLSMGTLLAVVLGLSVVILNNAWGAIFEFLFGIELAALFGGLLLLAAIAFLLAWLALRKATPKG